MGKVVETLPFTCPNCGEPFGFGEAGADTLLSMVRSVPFSNEPTPCCGYKISGNLLRNLDGSLELEVKGL